MVFAKYPEKLAPAVDVSPYLAHFPDINKLPRLGRKARLRAKIAEAKENYSVVSDPRTEVAPLILD